MVLLFACPDAPPALAGSPLQLVVEIYVATYLVFALIGAICLGVARVFNGSKEDGGPLPPEGGGGIPDPGPPMFDSHATRAYRRADGKQPYAPTKPRSAAPIGQTSRRSGRPSVRRRAFTLIELLVVIAVLAVVMSRLLPAVQAAQQAADELGAKADRVFVGSIARELHRKFPRPEVPWTDADSVLSPR